MKKLMIAAAFAAMVGGASANVCDNNPTSGPDCWVYDVKVTMKTLGPKQIKSTSKDCYNNAGDTEYVEYLVNTTRKFQGIAWACEGACEMPTEDGLNFVMWEPARKVNVTEPLKWVEIKVGDVLEPERDDVSPDGTTTNRIPAVIAKEAKKGWEADTLSFEIADRYDKKADKVEAYWFFDELQNTVTTSDGDLDGEGEIIAAGFGKFDIKNGRIASISGNAVGTITPTMKCNAPVLCDLCTEFEDWFTDGEAAEEVVMSGSWSMKFNKSIAAGKKTLGQVVPKYAQDK